MRPAVNGETRADLFHSALKSRSLHHIMGSGEGDPAAFCGRAAVVVGVVRWRAQRDSVNVSNRKCANDDVYGAE